MTDVDAARPSEARDDPAPVSRDWARRQRRGDAPRRTGGVGPKGVAAYGLATLVFVAGLVSLVWKGWETSLDIKGGSSFHAETDPTKPGYEAQVKPVPNHLVLNVDAEGRLTDAELLVEIGGKEAGSGVVMPIPGATLIESDAGPADLRDFLADHGVEAAVGQLERILGFAITDTVTLSPQQIAELFRPAGHVTFQNPDALIATLPNGDKEIRYGAGQLTLSADEVAAYLAFTSDGEAAVNRSVRLGILLEAWIESIRANPALAPTIPPLEPVVGDGPVDLAALITSLAGDTISYPTFPVQTIPIPGAEAAAVYRPDAEKIEALVPSLVPYPTSAFPGQRARTRVLNGTSDRDAAPRAAPLIVGAGAEITVFGNATGASRDVTTVEYHDDGVAAAAERIATALGVTATRSSSGTEAYDVTVTLGADFKG
jgi:hypothetical protein